MPELAGWHEGALAGFDLETTGPDPETDRIVTAALVIREAGCEPVMASWLIDPGIAWKIAATHPEIAQMPLAELHQLQVKAKREQSASFQDYLRRQGKSEVIDGSWPYRPYEAAEIVTGGAP